VRTSNFEDAKNTFTSACLIGPPTVEFALHSRVPGGRRRTDARAGTIDQDPEFMAFLEGLANPTSAKDTANEEGEDSAGGKPEKVTVTPLVQFLKDKKANKTKEAAAKAAKKQETAKAKAKEGSSSTDDGKKSGKDSKAEKVAASQEAVKILNREAAKKTAAASSASSTATAETATTEKTVPKLDTSKIPANERQAVVAAHVRMLRRDLGLNPSQAHRRIKRDTAAAVKAEAAEKTTAENNNVSSPSTPVTPTGPKVGATPPSAQSSSRRNRRGNQNSNSEAASSKTTSTPATPTTPMVLLRKPEARPATPATPVSQPAAAAQTTPGGPATPQQSTPNRAAKVDVPTKGARQAFIKHANPSQGVTEPLLQEALEKFGKVTMVEIDKKKGFAYADFEDPEGLKKAMAANPISVAQGTVHVLQRKGTSQPRPAPAARAPAVVTPPARGGRGGSMGRRGGRAGGGGRGGANANAVAAETSKAPPSAPTGPAGK
jgi:regulator of nonsense transcripts 3